MMVLLRLSVVLIFESGLDGEVYLVFLPNGGSTDIELPAGKSFTLAWFNPRTGEVGDAEPLDSKTLTAPDKEDWVALIR